MSEEVQILQATLISLYISKFYNIFTDIFVFFFPQRNLEGAQLAVHDKDKVIEEVWGSVADLWPCVKTLESRKSRPGGSKVPFLFSCFDRKIGC